MKEGREGREWTLEGLEPHNIWDGLTPMTSLRRSGQEAISLRDRAMRRVN